MTTFDVILGVLILVIFALSWSAGFSSGKCVAYHDINKILGETQDDYDELRATALELCALLEKREGSSACAECCDHADRCEESGVCWYESRIDAKGA